MAKKEKKTRVLVGLLAVLIGGFNFLFSSCDEEHINEITAQTKSIEQKEKPNVPDEPEPPTPTKEENWWLVRDSINDGHSYEFNILAGDSTSGATAVSRGWATMDEEDRYTIEEKYRNLNLSYANANRVLGDPECTFGNNGMRVTTLATFGLEDGNVVKVSSTIGHAMAKPEGVTPCDSLVDVRLISVRNIQKNMTRAAATYISDSVYTEIKAELTYVTTGLKQNYAYVQVIGDTITRFILSNNDVDTIYAENKQRTVLSSTTEQCSFDKVVKFKNGEKNVLRKNIILQYGVQTIPEYEKIVKSFNYMLSKSNGVSKGEVKLNRAEESWKVSRRTDKYSAIFTNPAENISSDYTLFHEGAVYQDADIKVEFPVLDMAVAEGNTSVTSIVGDDYYDKARLSNTINVSYQGYPQTAGESVVLKIEKRRKISEGWDKASAKKTISLWSVDTSIDYVVKYSDSTEERSTYKGNWSWSFVPVSSWDVNADDSTYYTGNVNASIDANSKTRTKEDVVYNWNENSHTLTANVTVANGTQLDKWLGKTVNDITITRNGNTYNFGHDDYSLTDKKASLGKATVNDTESVYPYTHAVEFGFGGVKVTAAVYGKIHVKKPIIPPFFPSKVQKVTTIVCNNPSLNGYMYSGLAHLEGGVVVPFSYDKKTIVWHLDNSVTTSSTKLNGAVYEHSSRRWIPVYAYDSPDCLEYLSESGHSADNQSYAKANQLNWDEGHKVNGHASVTTNRLSFTIKNGVVTAKDMYTNTSLGSWTY